VLFTGYVTVNVGELGYEIPFTARIDDLVGPVFEQTAALRDANTISVTLRNAIEGSIQLLAPPAASVSVQTVGKPISCRVQGGPPAFPVELKAVDYGRSVGDQLQICFTSAARLEEGQYQVLLETNHRVESTGAAVLEAVMDPRVATNITRNVAVKIPAGVFAARAAQSGGAQLIGVEVVFETGASASFESPAASDTEPLLTQWVTIQRSIVDYLLGSSDDGSYRYRIDWIYNDGHRQQESAWRTDNVDSLIPDLIIPRDAAQGERSDP